MALRYTVLHQGTGTAALLRLVWRLGSDCDGFGVGICTISRLTPFSKLVFMPAVVFLCSGLLNLSPIVQAEDSSESFDHGETLSEEYIKNLNRTRLLTHDSVYEQLSLKVAKKPRRQTKEFVTADTFNPPYEQSFNQVEELKYRIPRTQELFEHNEKKGTFIFRGQESVFRWFVEVKSNTEVCAIQFEDESRSEYQLRTFPTSDEATAAGYLITHAGHCGTCSSLKNLAIYLTNRDLTTAARTCGRKRNAKKIKSCLMDDVGGLWDQKIA